MIWPTRTKPTAASRAKAAIWGQMLYGGGNAASETDMKRYNQYLAEKQEAERVAGLGLAQRL